MAGRKPKPHATYGRHKRNKSISHVYDLPLSPPKKLQPRRSWTSINKDRSARQIIMIPQENKLLSGPRSAVKCRTWSPSGSLKSRRLQCSGGGFRSSCYWSCCWKHSPWPTSHWDRTR
jgi:hypothetical protein